MGIKNIYQIEGVINTIVPCLCFLNRSIPFYCIAEIFLKPTEQRFLEIYEPFIDEISWLAIIKLFDLKFIVPIQ